MKVEVNIEKKYAFAIIIGLLIVAGTIVAYAYGTSSPSVFGHSFDELEGVQKKIVVDCPTGKGIGKIDSAGAVTCRQAYLYNLSFYTATGANSGNVKNYA